MKHNGYVAPIWAHEYAMDEMVTLQRKGKVWIVLNDESALQDVGDVYAGTLPDCMFTADDDALALDAYGQREFVEIYYNNLMGD